MLKQAIFPLALCLALTALVTTSDADEWVRGYFRSNGTYVQPYYRSSADGNFYNNWSTYPNINPYTGRTGTRLTPPSSYGYRYQGYSYPSYRSYYRW